MIRSCPMERFNEIFRKRIAEKVSVSLIIQEDFHDLIEKTRFENIFIIKNGPVSIYEFPEEIMKNIQRKKFSAFIIPCNDAGSRGYDNLLKLAYYTGIPEAILMSGEAEMRKYDRTELSAMVKGVSPKEHISRYLELMRKSFSAFTLYLILRFINVFKKVKIGSLNTKSKPSIIIAYIEGYWRPLQQRDVKSPLLFVISPALQSANKQLSKMYSRAVYLIDERHPQLREIFIILFNWLEKYRAPLYLLLGIERDQFAVGKIWANCKPVISFTEKETLQGIELLEKIGIPKKSQYICFGLRENSYYTPFQSSENQSRAPNLDDFPDTYVRNPPLINFIPVLKKLSEKGYYILRMGVRTDEKLPEIDPHVIDYANKFRTEFGDIFLLGNCTFCITGGGAGLWWINAAFNRNTVFTDTYSLIIKYYFEGDLFIPKKVWNRSKKRFLTFREMLSLGFKYSYEGFCKQNDLELVHNTTEEIADVVEEMVKRKKGLWIPQEGDEELHKRYDSLFMPGDLGYGMKGCIGMKFLRDHQELLN